MHKKWFTPNLTEPNQICLRSHLALYGTAVSPFLKIWNFLHCFTLLLFPRDFCLSLCFSFVRWCVWNKISRLSDVRHSAVSQHAYRTNEQVFDHDLSKCVGQHRRNAWVLTCSFLLEGFVSHLHSWIIKKSTDANWSVADLHTV